MQNALARCARSRLRYPTSAESTWNRRERHLINLLRIRLRHRNTCAYHAWHSLRARWSIVHHWRLVLWVCRMDLRFRLRGSLKLWMRPSRRDSAKVFRTGWLIWVVNHERRTHRWFDLILALITIVQFYPNQFHQFLNNMWLFGTRSVLGYNFVW